MSGIRYAKFDPTGNITVLVTGDVPAGKQAETARIIMRDLEPDCEQVGFVTENGMRMMGGEFCGNATMSTGCLLAVRNGCTAGSRCLYRLSVSGAEKPVLCEIQVLSETEFIGTVEMPLPESIEECSFGTVVRFDGIAHILTAETADEARLRMLAAEFPESAVGMIETRCDGETAEITPLVYVKPTDTAVFEHGCGSGSAAVGAAYALSLRKDGDFTVHVSQPGGVIRVGAKVENGAVTRLTITGRVRLMKTVE